jgi:hypothetical protein
LSRLVITGQCTLPEPTLVETRIWRFIINWFSTGAQRGLSTSLAASHYTVFAKEAFTIIFK